MPIPRRGHRAACRAGVAAGLGAGLERGGRPAVGEGVSATWGHRVFFPVAAVYGAAVVPLSLQAMTSPAPWVPALASPAGHARELLFGYALAVVAGYLTGRGARWPLWGLLGLWALARIAWLVAPGSTAAMLAQAAFALAFAAAIVPKFIGRRRKWRNLAVAPLITLLAASAVAFDLTAGRSAVVARSTVLLLAWLMAFMGGRLIAPAVAGQLERQGIDLAARVQPRLEGAIIAALAAAAVLALDPRGATAAGGCALLAAVLIAARLLRWRLPLLSGRSDLWCLAAGYAWLALGLAAAGAWLLLDGRAPSHVLHAITVGALGTFTYNVMLRTQLQRGHGDPASERLLPLGTLLIAVAAAARIGAPYAGATQGMLLGLAAASWCAAFLLLAHRLVTVPA